ncbi:RNA polymerase II degradation factor 1 [Arabidopsis lyrata subsp. lyrata]|uniref:RNA polymerase II degradation factor 1 n=1 Tax=Arabidopsis lyrata subsp. lyrata TaxID=81972 RepID=UPI000A29EA17|nr:RNA polymerase II degradation factor 1 [Arabidopsis lyrata subsp. lyrata]|eukprot:XP_020876445.1 RNA polymerase II degradation factor 1 [Arabidopsis lyrata subsp. lyrata]
MVLFLVVKNKGDHKPLNVGATLLITETKAPLGRVDGYFFGSLTNPHYIVRLADSEMQVPQSIGLSFIEEFTQHIEEEDLYKRFHYPTGYEFDLIEEEGECGPMEVLGRTSYHYENRIFCLQQYEPMMYQQEQIFMRPETNQQEQQYQPMMYEQEQQFVRPETNQQNQMGINLFPRQAPMMQHQQFMRHESSQQNQMGIIPNLVQNQAPMMYNQQQNFIRPAEIIPNQSLMLVADLVGYLKQYLSGQMSTVVQGGPSGSFGVNLNYHNQQQFGSEMDFNPQTQPTIMESQLYDAGPSSYRGGRGRY